MKYWKDVVTQASGNTIAQLIGILGMPVLTRLYSPESFATLSIFLQLVILFSAFTSLRYEYFLPLMKSKKDAISLSSWIVKTSFLNCLMFTAIFWIIYEYDVWQLVSINNTVWFLLVPFSALAVSLSLAVQHEAQRVGNFFHSAISEIISKSGYVLIAIFISFMGITQGLLISVFASYTFKGIYLGRYAYFGKINTGVVKQYKARSLGLVYSNTTLVATGITPLIFIGSFYGDDELGQFTLVLSTIFLPSSLVGSAIGNVFYQRIGKYWNNTDYSSMVVIWKETLVKLLSVAIPAYSVLFFISEWIYPFVFGADWVRAGEFAKLMTVAAMFSFIAGPLDRITLVLGISKYIPIIHSLRMFLVVGVTFYCYIYSLALDDYLTIYSISLVFVYLFDILCGRFFMSHSRRCLNT